MPEEQQNYSLERIIDRKTWAHLQGLFSSIAGTLMLYEDSGRHTGFDGDERSYCRTHGQLCVTSQPVVPISGDNPYCRALRQSPQGRSLCESYCTTGMKQALDLRSSITFRCYAGLMNFAIPVSIEDKYRLVLLGGRKLEATAGEDTLAEVAADTGIAMEALQPFFKASPVESMETFRERYRVVEELAHIVLKANYQRNNLAGTVSRLKALLGVNMDITTRGASAEVFDLFLNSLEVLYNASAASIMILETGSRRFNTVATLGPQSNLPARYECQEDNGLAAVLKQHRSFLYINEELDLRKAGLSEEVTTCFSFPFFRNDRLMGMVNIFNTELAPDDAMTIASFCGPLYIAVENAALRGKLNRQMDTLTRLMDLSSALGVPASAENLFRTILDKSADLLRAEQGSLMLFNEETEELAIKATKGFSEKIVEHFRIRPGEGIAGKVMLTGKPLVVSDIESDARVDQRRRPRYKTKSFLSMPLSLGERSVGVLNLADRSDGASFSEDDLPLMSFIANQASCAIERMKLQEISVELHRVSITDALTGLLSRRYFDEMLTSEIERALRYSHSLSLMMLDLDNFKPYNDTCGHQAGDEILKVAAKVMEGAVRGIDMVVRYGGDEFAIILPETGKEAALSIGNRIRHDLASSFHWKSLGTSGLVAEIEECLFEEDKASFAGKVEGMIPLTVSIGIATVPNDAATARSLISKADKALYKAKTSGRNRVEIIVDKETPPIDGRPN